MLKENNMKQLENKKTAVQEQIRGFRILRLNEWIKEHPELKMGSNSHVSQLRHGKTAFGDRAARNIEHKWGMPDGYLDGVVPPENNFVSIRCFDAKTYFNQLDREITNKSLITGNDLLRGIDLPRAKFNGLFSHPVSENTIKLLSIQGDTMCPDISNQDVLLIDTSIQRLVGNGIYVFILYDLVYVQRLQATPSGIISIAANPQYENIAITDSMENDLIIVAKCIAKVPFQIQML